MKIFNVIALFSLVGPSAVYGATVTFKDVVPSTACTIPIGPTGYSYYASFSELGVKTDGSETTYVEEIRESEAPLPTGGFIPLNTTVTAMATMVQATNGFWFSLGTTVSSGDVQLEYESCSLQSDGQYACVDVRLLPGLRTTFSYTNTAYEWVQTDVGEIRRDQNAAVQTGSSAALWGLAVVASAMAFGVAMVAF
ncbi:hypothetical protein L218DRAFT_984439 [Marasmius fiardii PR-910]|nr:hypothetical protein L218DRAFT_984439 [Marasmius fiardii PR-910]